MKPKEFIAHLDEGRVLAAIEAAEQKSSGEIRVFVSHQNVTDPLAAAQKQFEKLGMTRTRARNGVLLFFAPVTQKFAVIGDAGIHEKCGPAFWEELTRTMEPDLKSGHFTEAVLAAVQGAGDALARHFPRAPGDINELPNRIERD